MTVAEAVKDWLHPDAKEAMEAFYEESEVAYSKTLASIRKTYGDMTLPPQPAMDPDAVEVIEEQAKNNEELNNNNAIL